MWTLKWVVLIFAVGFILYRSSSVRMALITGALLGGLWATGEWGDVVHNLDGLFDLVT